VTPAGVVFLKQAQQLGLDEKLTLVHSYGFVTGKYKASDAISRLTWADSLESGATPGATDFGLVSHPPSERAGPSS
jgi:hypothetical protein